MTENRGYFRKLFKDFLTKSRRYFSEKNPMASIYFFIRSLFWNMYLNEILMENLIFLKNIFIFKICGRIRLLCFCIGHCDQKQWNLKNDLIFTKKQSFLWNFYEFPRMKTLNRSTIIADSLRLCYKGSWIFRNSWAKYFKDILIFWLYKKIVFDKQIWFF